MYRPHIRFGDKTVSAVSIGIIGAAIVLVIAGTALFINQQQQKVAIDAQTETTNQLVREVKQLSEDNKKLNIESRNYAYCNAVLLAKYTQDQQPIVIENLDKCVLQSFPEGVSSDLHNNAVSLLIPQSSPQTQNSNVAQSLQPSSTPSPTSITPVQQPTTEPIIVGGGEQAPSNQTLAVPGVLQLNTPCIMVLQIIKTCNQ